MFQRYLFVGIGDVQAGYEELWSCMGGPCMMAYIEIWLDVGYVWGLRMQFLPGVGYIFKFISGVALLEFETRS